MSKAINYHWYKQAIELAIVSDNFHLAEKYYTTLFSQAQLEKNEQLLTTCEILKHKIEKGLDYYSFDTLTERANLELRNKNYEGSIALYQKARDCLENSNRSEVNKIQYLEYVNSKIRIIEQRITM